MKKVRALNLPTLCLAIVAMAPAWGQLMAEESAIKIVSPLPDGIVERVTEVVVETTEPGHPLILVRSLDATVEWWAQPVVAAREPGRIILKCYFGNANTPDGKAFQMVALLVPSNDQAKALVKQQVFSELPTKLAYSEPRRVVRTNDAAKTVKTTTASKTVKTASKVAITTDSASPTTKLLGLSDRSTVSRRQELSGQAADGVAPVLLVRSAAKNSRWWVQAPAEIGKDNRFTVMVRFGNEKTPAGSEFELVAVPPGAAEQFKAGESFKELPSVAKEAPRLVVVLGDSTGAE